VNRGAERGENIRRSRGPVKIAHGGGGYVSSGNTVVLFIPVLGIGGAELQLGMLATRLAAAGWNPIVATMDDLHGTAPRLVEAGVEVVILPRAGRTGVDTISALARLVRKRRPHVLHAWLFASNWRAAVTRLLVPDTRVLASIRGMEDDVGPMNLIAYRALAPLIDAILVNSRAVLARSAERTGIPREKYRLVRNGVELRGFDGELAKPVAFPWDSGPGPVVGYVGTLHSRKRAASLAPIAARVLSSVPGARFLVVGGGPEDAHLKEECARLGVADRFTLVGYQDHVAPFLRRMSVLVHPSMNEGSSNSILEAMAAGIPVVAYAVSGNRETIAHGETGWLASDGDVDALAAAVSAILRDPDQGRRLGAAGRERIERDYSVDAMVRATVAVYDEVHATSR
jgi:glycosyltransferase involved in cell wall biosynthesis